MQRIGKKGQAYFRLVVLEHTTRPKGEYLELLGSYDPHANKLIAKADRVKYWMSQGAQLSPTANNLLIKNKLIEGEKVTVWKPKKITEAQKKSESSEAKPTEELKVEKQVEAESQATEIPSESEVKPEISAEETPLDIVHSL